MTTGKLSRRSALAVGLSGLLWPRLAWPDTAEREVEGGIGGTGIVGVLTDFSSLIVSGNRVATDGQTAFSDGFGPLSEADIRIGDSLTVEAAGPSEALVARRVHVTHPLVGRVGAVMADGRGFTVNGVSVFVQPNELSPSVGERVTISGLWQDRGVMASRISPASGPLDLVSGDVSRAGRTVRIGTVATRGRGLAGLANGSFASAIGRYDPDQGVMRATDLTTARFVGAAGALARLSIEGYLSRTDAAPGYRVAGLGHSFERNLDLRPYADARVLFNGRYTGRFAAESALFLPEAETRRRQLLRQLAEN